MVQKRRLEVATGTPGIGDSFIDIDFEDDAMVNFHGLRVNVALEPQNADANSNGVIAVWNLPGGVIQNSDLPTTFGAFGDEKFSQYLWGWTTWASSNQTPFHWEFAPATTRNKARDSRVVVQIHIAGITQGVMQQNTLITGFVTPVTK